MYQSNGERTRKDQSTSAHCLVSAPGVPGQQSGEHVDDCLMMRTEKGPCPHLRTRHCGCSAYAWRIDVGYCCQKRNVFQVLQTSVTISSHEASSSVVKVTTADDGTQRSQLIVSLALCTLATFSENNSVFWSPCIASEGGVCARFACRLPSRDGFIEAFKLKRRACLDLPSAQAGCKI